MSIEIWNTIIVLGYAQVLFLIVIYLNNKYGEQGLILIMVLTYIGANIQFLKMIEVILIKDFLILGGGLIVSHQLAFDILHENYGYERAKRGIKLSIEMGLVWTFIFQITIIMVGSETSRKANEAIGFLFGLSIYAYIASIISYWIGQKIDIYVFRKIKTEKKWKKGLTFRVWMSSLIAGFFDTLSFSILFYVIFKGEVGITLGSLLISYSIIPYIYRIILNMNSLFYLRWIKKGFFQNMDDKKEILSKSE